MISRSGLLRAAFAISGAALLVSFAACGGKVIGEGGGGGDDSSSNPPPDGGKNDGSTSTCTGTISCPVCEGDPNSGQATCVDGQWQCAPTTKCVPPPPDSCDTIPAPDCACGEAKCVNEQWACAADCGGYCPASVDNLGGQPCETEGLICGDECGDPCQVCNYVACTSGTWIEVQSTPVACDAGPPNGG
jgi:hypothetical protein